MEKEYANLLLQKVKNDYNLISDDFSSTRSFVSKEILSLTKYISRGDKILDLGCGNGRFFEVLGGRDIDYSGVDVSEKLVELAGEKYPQARFAVADALNLPFLENAFDKIFSIAVFHHIPSEELRRKFLEETKRVLKPGGLLVLRVWDFWSNLDRLSLLFIYSILKFFRKTKLDYGDIFVVWKDRYGRKVTDRYFHCFTKYELEKNVKEAGFEVKEIWKQGKGKLSNIYLVARKI